MLLVAVYHLVGCQTRFQLDAKFRRDSSVSPDNEVYRDLYVGRFQVHHKLLTQLDEGYEVPGEITGAALMCSSVEPVHIGSHLYGIRPGRSRY